MKYLQIKNAGEISPHALSLMGASTKRGNAGQIGFFGTGNKYALALFMRTGLDVQIYSGINPIEITTKQATLGENTYNVVCIGGESTSITTDMGPTWHIWQAVREVYSNAIDCGDNSIGIVNKASPESGVTTYCVEVNDEVQAVFDNFHALFSEGRESIETCDDGMIFNDGTGTVYRHGIRCNAGKAKSLFDYEVGGITLSEDRIASYPWQVGQSIWRTIFNSENPDIIEPCLRVANNKDFIEGEYAQSSYVDFSNSISPTMRGFLARTLIASDAMAPLMSESEKAKCLPLPNRMIDHLIEVIGADSLILPRRLSTTGKMMYSLVEPSPNEAAILKRCLSIISDAGIRIRYPVVMVEFADPQYMGLADTKSQRILISEKTFSKGETIMISTLLEEWIHLKHGVRDETREMQDAIFDEFATVIMSNKS